MSIFKHLRRGLRSGLKNGLIVGALCVPLVFGPVGLVITGVGLSAFAGFKAYRSYKKVREEIQMQKMQAGIEDSPTATQKLAEKYVRKKYKLPKPAHSGQEEGVGNDTNEQHQGNVPHPDNEPSESQDKGLSDTPNAEPYNDQAEALSALQQQVDNVQALQEQIATLSSELNQIQQQIQETQAQLAQTLREFSGQNVASERQQAFSRPTVQVDPKALKRSASYPLTVKGKKRLPLSRSV